MHGFLPRPQRRDGGQGLSVSFVHRGTPSSQSGAPNCPFPSQQEVQSDLVVRERFEFLDFLSWQLLPLPVLPAALHQELWRKAEACPAMQGETHQNQKQNPDRTQNSVVIEYVILIVAIVSGM